MYRKIVRLSISVATNVTPFFAINASVESATWYACSIELTPASAAR